MTNDYGAPLDSNGYAPSIFETDHCFCCFLGASATGANLARHEIFGGPNRQKSKRLGLWVLLCPRCHEAMHTDARRGKALKALGQMQAMQYYRWTADKFREMFGKSYL